MELNPSPTQTEVLLMSQLVRSRTPTPPLGNPQTPRPLSPVVPRTPGASAATPVAASSRARPKARFDSPFVTPKQKGKIIPKTPYPDDVDVEEDSSEEEVASRTEGISFETLVQTKISVPMDFSSAYTVEEQMTSEDGEGEYDEEMGPNVVML